MQCLSCSLLYCGSLFVSFICRPFSPPETKMTDKLAIIAEMQLQIVHFKYNSPFVTFKCIYLPTKYLEMERLLALSGRHIHSRPGE